MKPAELSKLKIRIRNLKQKISQLETRLSGATGNNKKSVAESLRISKTQLQALNVKLQEGSRAGDLKTAEGEKKTAETQNKDLKKVKKDTTQQLSDQNKAEYDAKQAQLVKEKAAKEAKQKIGRERTEEEGTFNITEAGILEVQDAEGNWVNYSGMFGGKEYFEGVTKGGAERVQESAEFGREQEQRVDAETGQISKDNEQLKAEIKIIIQNIDGAISDFASAKDLADLDRMKGIVDGLITSLRGV